jgi:beta-lactamase class A
MRPAPPVRPVHAGSLARWERLAFTAVFVLMVTFVVVVTISAIQARRAGGPPPGSVGGAAPARGSQPDPAVHAGGKVQAVAGDHASHGSRAAWDRRLATALAPVLQHHTGNLAVGVIDRSTGARAVYGGGRPFHSASIIKADILAVLLLRHQGSETALGAQDQDLVTDMIEASDDDAADTLWNVAGAAGGMAAANARLGLRHTIPGPGDLWGLTSTTAGDQLALLRDLTTARSPLSSGSRAYELGLMRNVEAAQRWGVSAAATPGSVYAIKDGWLPGGPSRLWVINSIGALDHEHQKLLMVVLSNDQPTEAVGIAQVDAAAIAAARCITSRR